MGCLSLSNDHLYDQPGRGHSTTGYSTHKAKDVFSRPAKVASDHSLTPRSESIRTTCWAPWWTHVYFLQNTGSWANASNCLERKLAAVCSGINHCLFVRKSELWAPQFCPLNQCKLVLARCLGFSEQVSYWLLRDLWELLRVRSPLAGCCEGHTLVGCMVGSDCNPRVNPHV